MQVGCCIRRAAIAFGAVSAVTLLASTGLAGEKTADTKSPDRIRVQTLDRAEATKARPVDLNSISNEAGVAPAKAPAQMNTEAAPANNLRGAPAGESCGTAVDLDADLAAGMGSATVSGDTSTSSYIVNEASNPELPAAPCSTPFADFSGAPGLFYSFTGDGNDYLISTCSVNTLFDTTISIFTGCGDPELTCAGGNGDAGSCTESGGPPSVFLSTAQLTTMPGETYYILVHGFGPTDSGAFELSVEQLEAFSCTPDQNESEVCVTEDAEEVNGGCNSPGTPLETLNTGVTLGILSSYESADLGGLARDTDWYLLDTSTDMDPSDISINITGDGDFVFGIITDGEGTPVTDCATAAAVEAFGGSETVFGSAAEGISGTACLAPGQYWFFVSVPADGADRACGVAEVQYCLDVSVAPCEVAACCLPDGTCMNLNTAECADMGGTFFSGEDCATFTCVGFCCLFEEDPIEMSRIVDLSQSACEGLVAGGSARAFLGYNLTMAEQDAAFCPARPINDDCVAATLVTFDGMGMFSDTGTVLGATPNDEFPPNGAAPNDDIVFYVVEGTGNTITVSLDNPGTAFDTVLAVWCSGPNVGLTGPFCPPDVALFPVAFDDDGGDTGLTSELSFCSNAGDAYVIGVQSFSGGGADGSLADGSYEITVNDDGVECMDATSCVLCDVMCTGTDESLDSCTVDGNLGCFDPNLIDPTQPAAELAFVGDTICGNIGDKEDGAVDLDQIVLINPTEQVVTIDVSSETPLVFAVLDYINGGSDAAAGVNCDNLATDADGAVFIRGELGEAENCIDGQISLCLPQGEWLVIVQSAAPSTCEQFDEYSITFAGSGVACPIGACCDLDGMCTEVNSAQCLDAGGVFFESETCATAICTGACCLQGDPGTSLCEDRSFNACADDPNALSFAGIGTTCAVEGVDCPVTPLNGECDDAISLPTDGTPIAGSNAADADGIVWYEIMGTGETITVTTCSANTDYDTLLNVLCRACDDLVFVATNDDAGIDCEFSGLQSTVSFCSEAGTSYFVQVTGFGAIPATGNFEVSATSDGVACTPDVVCAEVGACCLSAVTDECVVTTEADCMDQGGVYLGDNTDCGGAEYQWSGGAATFTSIQATGTPVVFLDDGSGFGATDDGVATISLPFAFDFFGTTIPMGADLNIHTNGFASFDMLDGAADSLFLANADATSPNNLIAPLWSDQQNVSAWTEVVGGNLVIEWDTDPLGLLGLDDLGGNYQAILSPSGDITFVYGPDPFEIAPGGSPAFNLFFGVQNADGSIVSGPADIASGEERVGTFVVEPSPCPAGPVNDCQFDFDNNGSVDGADFGTFGAAFGSMMGDANYNPQADSNNDGVVDGADFGALGAEFGRTDCLMP